jgi:GNAT superfamily N-acetyltransferase
MFHAPIEPLTLDDATALASLSTSVSWRDTPADWRNVLSIGRVVGLRAAGAPIAVAARFDFGPLWSIGKVIVHPSHQGRGHARRILEHLIEDARAPGTHVTLVATPQGEPVYRRLGFRQVGEVHKLVGMVAIEPSESLRPLDARTLDGVLALDREVFGADRAALLTRRLQASTRAFVIESGGAPTGYGVAVEQGGHMVLGPVIAAHDDDALTLVRALLTREVRPRRIDVPSSHRKLIARLVALGFRDLETRPVMSLGGTPPPGDLARRFALAAQAFG